jgi:hypothetical protein
MIAFVLGKLGPPARTYVLFGLYVLAAGLFFSRALGFDSLLLITVGGSSSWILGTLLLRQRSGSDAGLSPTAAART